MHPIDVSISQVPLSGLRIGADIILPSTAVRDLGIHLDTDVGMRFHVSQLESGCFAVLRQLRSIRPSVTRPVFVSLVVSLVLSRLDYGNATFAGITEQLTGRLQPVVNAAARLINGSNNAEHVTTLLHDLQSCCSCTGCTT